MTFMAFPNSRITTEILRALKQSMPSAAENYILFRKFLAFLWAVDKTASIIMDYQ